MEYSCLATLAGKYSSTVSKVRDKYAQGKEWSVKYKTSSGVSREKKIVKPTDCRNSGECADEIVRHIPTKKFTNNSIRERLLAEKCELCGKHGESLFEIHHVASLKELSGTRVWEAVMQKMRRKTLVVCEDCHASIHGE
jgi:hypothetical protein